MLERKNNNKQGWRQKGRASGPPVAAQAAAQGHLRLPARDPLLQRHADQAGRSREPQNHLRSGWKESLAEKQAGRESRKQVKRETPWVQTQPLGSCETLSKWPNLSDDVGLSPAPQADQSPPLLQSHRDLVAISILESTILISNLLLCLLLCLRGLWTPGGQALGLTCIWVPALAQATAQSWCSENSCRVEPK